MKKLKNTINININEEDIFAEYGYENQDFLETSFVEAIEHLANSRPTKEKITINMKETKPMSFDQESFIKAYKNSFRHRMETKKQEINRCILTGILMFVFSIAYMLLHLYVISDISESIAYFSDIAAWVFIWCSIEVLTLELIQLIIDYQKIKRIFNANLVLIEYKEQQ